MLLAPALPCPTPAPCDIWTNPMAQAQELLPVRRWWATESASRVSTLKVPQLKRVHIVVLQSGDTGRQPRRPAEFLSKSD